METRLEFLTNKPLTQLSSKEMTECDRENERPWTTDLAFRAGHAAGHSNPHNCVLINHKILMDYGNGGLA